MALVSAQAARAWAEDFRSSPHDERWSAALAEARVVYEVIPAADPSDRIDALAGAFLRAIKEARASEQKYAMAEARAYIHGKLDEIGRAISKFKPE